MSLDQVTAPAPVESASPATPSADSSATENRYEGMIDPDAKESAPEPATPAQGDDDQSADLGDDTGLSGDEGLDEPDPWSGYEDFEIDGKKLKIPSEAKEYMLRQADYTRKAQEVAETRKQIEAQSKQLEERYQVSEEEFQTHVALSNVAERLKQFEGINWAQLMREKSDDILATQEIQTARLEFEQLRELYGQLGGKAQEAQKKRIETAEAEKTARLTATRDFAQKEIKGWTPEYDQKLTEFAIKELGFDRDTLVEVYNPAVYKTLHLAQLGHLSQQRQRTAQPAPLAQASPTQRVSAKANPAVTFDPIKASMADYVKARQSGKFK